MNFAVRRIKHAPYGRREIEIAEQGMFVFLVETVFDNDLSKEKSSFC